MQIKGFSASSSPERCGGCLQRGVDDIFELAFHNLIPPGPGELNMRKTPKLPQSTSFTPLANPSTRSRLNGAVLVSISTGNTTARGAPQDTIFSMLRHNSHGVECFLSISAGDLGREHAPKVDSISRTEAI